MIPVTHPLAHTTSIHDTHTIGHWAGASKHGSTEPPLSTAKVEHARGHLHATCSRDVYDDWLPGTACGRLSSTEGLTRSSLVLRRLPNSKTEGASAVVACGRLRYARRKSARSDSDVERLDETLCQTVAARMVSSRSHVPGSYSLQVLLEICRSKLGAVVRHKSFGESESAK